MRSGRTGDILLSLSLILLLAICSFMVLFYEADAYQAMNEENRMSEEAHLPYAYLMNRLRKGKKIICLDDELVIVEELTETHVYLQDGHLFELTTIIGKDIDRKAGERLFALDSFRIEDDGRTIRIGYAAKGSEKELLFQRRTDDE